MINFSTEFKEKLAQSNREYLVHVKIVLTDGTQLNLYNSDISWGNVTIDDAVSEDSNFAALGSAAINQFTFTISNIDEDYSVYDFIDAVVTVRIGLRLSSGVTEYEQKGIFIVDEAHYTTFSIEITALDYMAKFDKKYANTLSYPATLSEIIRDACTKCGVILGTSNFPHYNYSITTKPSRADVTYREVISMVAAIAGCYARINRTGQLELKWFDRSSLENAQSIAARSEYIYKNEWNQSYTNELGAFYDNGDTSSSTMEQIKEDVESLGVHWIDKLYTQDIEVNPIFITGVKISVVDEQSGEVIEHLQGSNEYAIELDSNNIFITSSNVSTILGWLGTQMIGLSFRKANVTQVSTPAIEAGDLGLIMDRKERFYPILITRAEFNPNSPQTIICSAESPSRRSSVRYNTISKSYSGAQQLVSQEKTLRELMGEDLESKINDESGLFETQQQTTSEGTIYYLHDRQNLEDSSVIMKVTRYAVGVSPDAGQTWFGLTVDGNLLINILSATGISADWVDTGTMNARYIKGGTLSLGGTANSYGNGDIKVYDSNDVLRAQLNTNGLIASRGTIGGFTIGDSAIYNGMTSLTDTDHTGVWLGNNGIALGKGVFKVTQAGVLTCTSGTIAQWRIGANNLRSYRDPVDTDGTYIQYEMVLNSPNTEITDNTNAFVIRNRSYTVSHDSDGKKEVSYGTYTNNIIFKYGGSAQFVADSALQFTSGAYAQFLDIGRTGQCLVSGTVVSGTIQKEMRIAQGRLVAYRHEIVQDDENSYWTCVLDQGLVDLSEAENPGNPKITRWGALLTYPSNKVGFGVTTSSTGNANANLVLWYDGTYNTSGTTVSDINSRGIISCARPLWMNGNNITAAGDITSEGTIRGQEFLQISSGGASGYAVTGLSQYVNNGTTPAYYQISYSNGYTFFYLNTGNIASIAPASSDRKLKKNIKPINNSLLKRIDTVELKQFKFKKDVNRGDAVHFGAIAQDVQEALGDIDSDMVYTAPDSEDLNLNYTEFLVLKIAAMDKRIKELEAKMEDMK